MPLKVCIHKYILTLTEVAKMSKTKFSVKNNIKLYAVICKDIQTTKNIVHNRLHKYFKANKSDQFV